MWIKGSATSRLFFEKEGNMASTTVGQSTTTTRTFERDANRKANRGIYWALGFAVLVVLAIVVARNYSTRPAAVTTPADTSSVAPPVNNGITAPSESVMPGKGADTYGIAPLAPDASSTTAPLAPVPERSGQ